MAPGASITLVEASSASTSDLLKGVTYAASHANVVSMSWGTCEFSGESSDDGDFSHAGVAFVASSGDSGAPVSWPAASPNVLAVGGTQLTLASNGTWSSEVGWSGSGGGPSALRGAADVPVGRGDGHDEAGQPGRRLRCLAEHRICRVRLRPVRGDELRLDHGRRHQRRRAAVVGDPGDRRPGPRRRAARPRSTAPMPSRSWTTLYQNPGDFHDITAGTSTGTPNYKAGPGYDYVTGLGSPMVNLVVGSLDGTLSTPTAPDTLVVSAPSTATAGGSFSFTVTADKPGGGVDTGYTGTISVHQHRRPGRLAGQLHLHRGRRRLAHVHRHAQDRRDPDDHRDRDVRLGPAPAPRPGSSVSPAAASAVLPVRPLLDRDGGRGAVLHGHREGCLWQCGDRIRRQGATSAAATPGPGLPASATLTSGSGVVHDHVRDGRLAVSDGRGPTSITAATQSGISVSPAAPTNLTADGGLGVADQPQLDRLGRRRRLPGPAQRQWRFELDAGRRHARRRDDELPGHGPVRGDDVRIPRRRHRRRPRLGVQQRGHRHDDRTATTVDSIWSNSYTPSENEYSWGSYELGVKFTSSDAGEVTGVRFYKQTWMGGYTHVGHLWSSTGTLLATATFTNETPSGWQQVSFSNPVAIAANTVYIVSFSTGGGYFGISIGFFNKGGVSRRPAAGPVQQHVRGRRGLQRRRRLPGCERLGDELLGGCRLRPDGRHERQDIDRRVRIPGRRDERAGRRGVHRRGVELRGRPVHGARADGAVELCGRLALDDGPGRADGCPSAWLRGPISATSRSR